MKLRSLVLIALFPLMAAASADPIDAKTLVKKVHDAYAAVKSARVTMEATGYAGDGKTGVTLLYAAPKKLKATVKGFAEGGGQTTFTTTGGTVAITDPDGKQAKQEIDFDQLQLPCNLETMSFWDYQKQLSTDKGGNMETSVLKVVEKEKWNDKEWIVLEEDAPAQKVSVRYFIDPKTYLIWRTVTTPYSGEQTFESWITKLELDVKVDDKEFKGR